MKTYTWTQKINPNLPDEDPLIIGLSAMRIPRDVVIAETIGEHAYCISDVNTGVMLYIPKELFESLYTPVEEPNPECPPCPTSTSPDPTNMSTKSS